MKQRIIIIGGMGPQASLELHRRMVQQALADGAKDSADFPYIVHLSMPVSDFITNESRRSEALEIIINELKSIGASMDDIIIIACNTTHLLQPDIEQRLNIRITSMADTAIDYVSRHYKTIRLLASPTTIRTGLYDKPLKAAGVTVLTPDEDEEQALEMIIRAVISGQAIPQSALDKIPITIQSEQANAVNYINNYPSSPPALLGCTELSCAFAEKPNTIDPMNILLRYLTTKGVL
jgi:aspartate racemase